MCAMSMVYDSYSNIPALTWTRPMFTEFQQIIERLDALDKKLGVPECHDPAKAIWAREIEERLAKLEGAVK